jgi:GT2 family glycosyltransferase
MEASEPGVRVSFVIPTAGRPNRLRSTLGRLAALDYPKDHYEIVVINDGRDGSSDAVVEEFARSSGIAVKFARQEKRGAGAARNHGAKLAAGSMLFFVDDDIEVGEYHVEQHLRTHEAHGPCLVNGREEWSPETMTVLDNSHFGRYRISLKERHRWPETSSDRGAPFPEPEALVACDLSIPKEVFQALGGFDEQFVHGGAEDRELGLRAAAKGYPLVRNDMIKVWHHDPVDSLSRAGSREERYARGVVTLARKFPEAYAGSQMLAENSPLTTGDPPRVVAKKVVKTIVTRRVPMFLIHRLIGLLEAIDCPQRYLDRLYSTALGLYMFRGVRAQWPFEGQATTSDILR